MLWLQRTSDPAAMPVSLGEAKAQCRYLTNDEDAFIGALIETATALLEGRNGMLGRALVTQTWKLKVDRFPFRALELPLPPLQSVASIKYLDTAGAEQTLAASEYIVDTGTLVGRVRPAYGRVWPVTQSIELAVEVVFTCGYGDAAAVPKPLRQAILMLVSHWFTNRGDIGQIPLGAGAAISALTSGERIGAF